MAADTPQHAIRDGEYRIIYVTGNRGLYKMFPDTGQILMFKAAGPGNQGHMAGYAGYGGPPKGIMEIVVSNYARVVGNTREGMLGKRHVPGVGWNSFGHDVAPGVQRWTSITSNKFNPDELLVLASETYGLNISPGRIEGHGPVCQFYAGATLNEAKIWYSPDCGDTWVPFTNITVNMPASISPREGNAFLECRVHKIQWDHVVDGRWAAIGITDNLYTEDGYAHYASALTLIVGDRNGNAHMWLRPFPNPLVNNSVWGPPNWPYLGTWGMGWSWVDPDPETGFHKIVFGATVSAGSMYQHVMAETSIPGPTGTSWQPAYNVNVLPGAVQGTEGIASAHFDVLDHHRGTLQVYHPLGNAQNSQLPAGGGQSSIGGQILWQQNYMEPTPGFNNNHWDFFIPGVALGTSLAAAADAIYIGGRSNGLMRLPYGATTYDQHTLVPGTEGHNIGGVIADQQHKTYVLAIDGAAFGVEHFLVFDGETWGRIEQPAGDYMNVGGITIINRTPLE